jgi:S-adenosylmethionine:tRNA ribosyltransferase-isomerase
MISGAGKDREADGSIVSDYDYELPTELIAQYPAEQRDASRLLTLGSDGSVGHGRFPDVIGLFAEGDLLVANESRVFPARLLGRKPTGAAAEVFLIRQTGDDSYVWEALVRPGGKLKPGRTVTIADDLTVEILATTPSGNRVVRLVTAMSAEEALERHGHIPLPPYIERSDDEVDRERYQTVYAGTPGSVAAPTAGLHFTEDLLRRIQASGVAFASVTLHVGIGTFRPIEVDHPADHPMHAESYTLSEQTAGAINQTRDRGGRVWAVGTTSVRTLESCADAAGRVTPGSGETRLFIRPPYDFRVVDGLITNFHLPRSTLLMLVAAHRGYEATMGAYREAVLNGYRFYSYGDAMVLPPGR